MFYFILAFLTLVSLAVGWGLTRLETSAYDHRPEKKRERNIQGTRFGLIVTAVAAVLAAFQGWKQDVQEEQDFRENVRRNDSLTNLSRLAMKQAISANRNSLALLHPTDTLYLGVRLSFDLSNASVATSMVGEVAKKDDPNKTLYQTGSDLAYFGRVYPSFIQYINNILANLELKDSGNVRVMLFNSIDIGPLRPRLVSVKKADTSLIVELEFALLRQRDRFPDPVIDDMSYKRVDANIVSADTTSDGYHFPWKFVDARVDLQKRKWSIPLPRRSEYYSEGIGQVHILSNITDITDELIPARLAQPQ